MVTKNQLRNLVRNLIRTSDFDCIRIPLTTIEEKNRIFNLLAKHHVIWASGSSMFKSRAANDVHRYLLNGTTIYLSLDWFNDKVLCSYGQMLLLNNSHKQSLANGQMVKNYLLSENSSLLPKGIKDLL